MQNDLRQLLKKCYKIASESPDPSNQNGAIILNENGWIVSTGANTFPKGIEYDPEKLQDREWKLSFIEHAERMAIFNLAKTWTKCNQKIMICPWFACCDCARAIVLSGVNKVIGHKQRMDLTPDRWVRSVEVGMEILKSGGVEIEFFDGKVDSVPIIVNGSFVQL